MIVDDDLEVLALLKKFFVQHGYSVEVATDGASLWSAMERQAPDLIILDPVSYTHLTLPTSDLV